jgi:hypothetical protein
MTVTHLDKGPWTLSENYKYNVSIYTFTSAFWGEKSGLVGG